MSHPFIEATGNLTPEKSNGLNVFIRTSIIV